jgi:2,5-diamino-6-(ribosylamino)-4(3H)-pyrimidinone 5'-phosphate reductase
MNRPYIICHMMTSVDGRIDCTMTLDLPGEEYYPILDSFDTTTHLSGKITSQMEIALKGKFMPKCKDIYGHEGFYKAYDAKGYDVIIDNVGELLYEESDKENPRLIITSEKVSKDYLAYLEERHISWIVVGKEHVDLKKACEILYKDFHVEKMVVVGGGHINAGFLKEGLLDEISILIGAGIDGREGMTSVFDGLDIDSKVKQLKLKSVKSYPESGAVWIRYDVK